MMLLFENILAYTIRYIAFYNAVRGHIAGKC